MTIKEADSRKMSQLMRTSCLLTALLLTTVLAGCSDKDTGVTPPQDEEGRYVIAMTDQLTFEPQEARIPVGATVVWVNNATVPHDVAGYEGDPIKSDFSEFSSGDPEPEGLGRLMAPGDQYNHTFAGKGTWTIWCHTHHEERMKGIVHVG